MAARTRFITAEYLYEFTEIDSNVDADLLYPSIDKSQRKVESVIGNALYTKIKNDIDSTGTTTGNYLSLLQTYIQPAQAMYVQAIVLPWISSKITNKSVSEKSSDNSQPSDLDKLKWLQQAEFNASQDAFDACIRYLKGNSQLFPEYYQSTMFNLLPENDDYFGGFYLGNGGGFYDNDCSLRNVIGGPNV